MTRAINFDISRPLIDKPFVVWGGRFPSGSIKYLTYKYHVESLNIGIPGFIEMSDASTALALDALAIERKISTIAICTPDGEKNLKAHGFQGKTIIPKDLTEGFHLCIQKEKEGWHWPRQFTNRTIIKSVERWAADLLPAIKKIPRIKTLVCGFGTGATVVGVDNVFSKQGYTVYGVEPQPGYTIHGWRNYDEKNLGEADLFYPFYEKGLLRQFEFKKKGLSPVEALLSHSFTIPSEEICIISHDGKPSDDE